VHVEHLLDGCKESLPECFVLALAVEDPHLELTDGYVQALDELHAVVEVAVLVALVGGLGVLLW